MILRLKTLTIFFTAAISLCVLLNISFAQVADYDGNNYKTVTFGNQVWFAENLSVTHYRNGDIIPQVKDDDVWESLTTGAWCYYENDSANVKTFGRLYNWYAVNDPRGLAPEGWHVSTEADWAGLVKYYGDETTAGGRLKAKTVWKQPNIGVSVENDFLGLPGGYRLEDGNFTGLKELGGFWTSTPFNFKGAWNRFLDYESAAVTRYFFDNKKHGLSVRCVKD